MRLEVTEQFGTARRGLTTLVVRWGQRGGKPTDMLLALVTTAVSLAIAVKMPKNRLLQCIGETWQLYDKPQGPQTPPGEQQPPQPPPGEQRAR